jgi:hypothetical protein
VQLMPSPGFSEAYGLSRDDFSEISNGGVIKITFLILELWDL